MARKKINAFTAEEIRKFLMEAPDSEFLGIKTVTVFAVFGAYWGCDLTNICVDHLTDRGTEISVLILDPNSKQLKEYSIGDQFAGIVRKYIKLRPPQIMTNRLFIHYRDGKCTGQHIGRNAIVKMPRIIAQYLALPDSAWYSGLSFRNIEEIRVSFATTTTWTQNVQQDGTFYLISTNQKILLQSSTLPNQSTNLRITHEDGQKFESDEYILSDTNLCTSTGSTAVLVKTEDETVQTTNISAEAHQDVNQNDDDIVSVISNDEFEAGDYKPNDVNQYPSHDNCVVTQHEAVHLSEDQQDVEQDDNDVISVASSTISEVELVVELDQLDENFSEANPKKKFKHSGDISVSMRDDTACQNRSLCQHKIKAQADEIAKLKQFIEIQNSKIKSLEALLLDDLQNKCKS